MMKDYYRNSLANYRLYNAGSHKFGFVSITLDQLDRNSHNSGKQKMKCSFIFNSLETLKKNYCSFKNVKFCKSFSLTAHIHNPHNLVAQQLSNYNVEFDSARTAFNKVCRKSSLYTV